MHGLVLSRKVGQAIVIDTPSGRIRILLAGIERYRGKLLIEAPKEWPVMREEIMCKEQAG